LSSGHVCQVLGHPVHLVECQKVIKGVCSCDSYSCKHVPIDNYSVSSQPNVCNYDEINYQRTSIINTPSVNAALANVSNVSDLEACLVQGAPINRNPVIIDETHCPRCLVGECAVDLSFSYTEVTHEGDRLGGAVLTDLNVNSIIDYNNTVAPYACRVHPVFESFDSHNNFQCNNCCNDMDFNVGDLLQKF
jgi:hypothetical protein